MLQVLRRTLFAKLTEKQFFQEKAMLESGITYPARWLNDRGARMPAAKYRRILLTVIDTIKAHGDLAAIRRASVYFLHCVQLHMQKHGDEYLQQAKSPRLTAETVAKVMRQAGKAHTAAEPDRTVEILAEMHRLSARKRRPILSAKSEALQADLFSQCKGSAKRPQKG